MPDCVFAFASAVNERMTDHAYVTKAQQNLAGALSLSKSVRVVEVGLEWAATAFEYSYLKW